MLFMIRFSDHPERLPVRQKYMQAHLNWLSQNENLIKVAGSLRQTETSQPEGALWIVEAESFEAAHLLYQSDPFWVNGLRQKVEVKSWSLAFDYHW